jgi:pteridine reductase
MITTTNKTALITGAARRIGREIALTLARSGYNIVVHHNASVTEAETLCEEIRSIGCKAWPISFDLRKTDIDVSLISSAMNFSPSLSVLINNASIFPKSTLENCTFDDLTTNTLINAWAPFALSREFQRCVGKGTIINIIDSRIKGIDNAHVAYLLSKMTLEHITLLCAAKFAPDISVNAIAPGLILPPAGKKHTYIEKRKNLNPMKKYGMPKDVAEAALFLCKSSYITGQIIDIDGGRAGLQGII